MVVLSVLRKTRCLLPACHHFMNQNALLQDVQKESVNYRQKVAHSSSLSHVDDYGKTKMVDVGAKIVSQRYATAEGRVLLGEDVFRLVQENQIKKGDVLTVAQIAAVIGAKKTSDLIPLCHNIPLDKIDVVLKLDSNNFSCVITSYVSTNSKTGVEMEALTAVSVAALTVYDMCKAVTKKMQISDIRLLTKSGGKSGIYNADSV